MSPVQTRIEHVCLLCCVVACLFACLFVYLFVCIHSTFKAQAIIIHNLPCFCLSLRDVQAPRVRAAV